MQGRAEAPSRQVMEHPDAAIAHASAQPAVGAPAVGFDHPTILRGSTAHFSVYYADSLGQDGITIADGVL
jgi:hypothetical protein